MSRRPWHDEDERYDLLREDGLDFRRGVGCRVCGWPMERGDRLRHPAYRHLRHLNDEDRKKLLERLGIEVPITKSDLSSDQHKVDPCATCIDENQAKRKAKLVLQITELGAELEEMADSQPDTEAAKALNFAGRRIREILLK